MTQAIPAQTKAGDSKIARRFVPDKKAAINAGGKNRRIPGFLIYVAEMPQ